MPSGITADTATASRIFWLTRRPARGCPVPEGASMLALFLLPASGVNVIVPASYGRVTASDGRLHRSLLPDADRPDPRGAPRDEPRPDAGAGRRRSRRRGRHAHLVGPVRSSHSEDHP